MLGEVDPKRNNSKLLTTAHPKTVMYFIKLLLRDRDDHVAGDTCQNFFNR